MKPFSANAHASATNAIRRERPGSVLSPLSARLGGGRGDAPRGTNARCSGRQTRSCSSAKNTIVSRQPTHSSPLSDVGQNTVLARPPISVSAVSAVRKELPLCWLSVANAASYMVIAIAMPAMRPCRIQRDDGMHVRNREQRNARDDRPDAHDAPAAQPIDCTAHRGRDDRADHQARRIRTEQAVDEMPSSARMLAPSTAIE